MPSIPAEWKQVLDRIQRVQPSAIIAGGALRDIILRRPVKDVDIFINASTGVYPAQILDLFPREDIEVKYEDEYGIGSDIKFIISLGKNYDYDIIVGDDVTCDPNQFDTSICQVHTSDCVHIIPTQAFLETLITKQVVVTNFARYSSERMNRLINKFPDYRIEECNDDIPF